MVSAVKFWKMQVPLDKSEYFLQRSVAIFLKLSVKTVQVHLIVWMTLKTATCNKFNVTCIGLYFFSVAKQIPLFNVSFR